MCCGIWRWRVELRRRRKKGSFSFQATVGWKVVEMSKYFPFSPCREILKMKGNSLKTTKPPWANVILGVKPHRLREITFRLQSRQWHKLAGNFVCKRLGGSSSPEGEWWSLVSPLLKIQAIKAPTEALPALPIVLTTAPDVHPPAIQRL